MKKPNITKGKWTLILEGDNPQLGVRSGQIIIPVIKNLPFGTIEQRSNSRAMSAVPEMIDALIKAYWTIHEIELMWIADSETNDAKNKIKEALKKAGVTDL